MAEISAPLRNLMEALALTGLVEVVQCQEYEVDGTYVMQTLSRLRASVKEAQWVHKIAIPVRQFSLRYNKKWSVRTAKEYVDKPGPHGNDVVYAFAFDVQAKEPELACELIAGVIRSGQMPAPESSAHADAQTLAELPDEIIERPLVWTRPGEEDRNVVRPVMSDYAAKTGNMFKPSRGASNIGGR